MDQTNNKSDIIDVVALLRQYASKWYLFAISVAVCVLLGGLYAMMKRPVYEVRANILIQEEDKNAASSLASAMSGMTMGLLGNGGSVDDEVFVVSSHSVLKSVVKDLQLNKKHILRHSFFNKELLFEEYPVDVYASPAVADTLGIMLQFKVRVNEEGNISIKALKGFSTIAETEARAFPVALATPYGKFMFNKTKYFKPGEELATNVYFGGYDIVAENLQEDIAISIANKKANVISLSMPSTTPDYAKAVLNGIITHYNERGINEKNLKSRKTIEFLDGRLKVLAQNLETSERDIEKYKKSQGIVDLQADAEFRLKRLGILDEGLVTAQTNYEVLRMTRDFITNPDNQYSLVPAPTEASEGLQTAIAAYNDVVIKRMSLESSAKGGNATLRVLNEQLAAMRKNINISLDKALDNARYALEEVQREVGKTKAGLGQIPTQEREYIDMKRQQSVMNSIYLLLLQQREDASMNLASAVPKGQVVDEAYMLSEPLGLTPIKILLIAFFVGLCLPPVYLYCKKLTRTKFATKEEVEDFTSVPVLGEVCISHRSGTLVVNGSSSAAELFRLIRSNLQFILSDDKVVLLTSTTSGEGKSFVSINLAATLALLGKKTVLVGMDIRAPKLADYLSLSPSHGLTEYLSNERITLDDIVLRQPVQKDLDIITAGPIPPNPAELLASKRVDELFAQLREEYDYIIVDSAPVGMVSDTFVLNRITDATVYVCRANYTPIRDFKFINSVKAEGRLKKMSLVVNGTASKKGYGYGYGQKTTKE